jgi:hypothetical protein
VGVAAGGGATGVGAVTGVGAEDAGGEAVTGGGGAAGGVLLEPAVPPDAVAVLATLVVVPPGFAALALVAAPVVVATVLADVALVPAVLVAVPPDFAVLVDALDGVDALAVVEVLELVPSLPQPASARKLAARNHCGKLIVRLKVMISLENQHWRAPRYSRSDAPHTCLRRATSAPPRADKSQAIPCSPSLCARAILAILRPMPAISLTQQLQMQRWQEDQIRRTTRALGHDPLALPRDDSQRAVNVKRAIRIRCGKNHPVKMRASMFDQAWERMMTSTPPGLKYADP